MKTHFLKKLQNENKIEVTGPKKAQLLIVLRVITNTTFFRSCDFIFYYFAIFSKLRLNHPFHVFYEIMCSSNFFGRTSPR